MIFRSTLRHFPFECHSQNEIAYLKIDFQTNIDLPGHLFVDLTVGTQVGPVTSHTSVTEGYSGDHLWRILEGVTCCDQYQNTHANVASCSYLSMMLVVESLQGLVKVYREYLKLAAVVVVVVFVGSEFAFDGERIVLKSVV